MFSKSNVRRFLNPESSFNVDDNDGCQSQIIDSLNTSEGVSGAKLKGVSKLRARNTTNLTDKDVRYQSKKITRSELPKGETNNVDGYDPSLEKFFLAEGSGSDDETEERVVSKKKKSSSKNSTKNKKSKKIDSSISGENSDEDQNGFSFVDDGDYSKYADDLEEESNEESEGSDDEVESDDQEEQSEEGGESESEDDEDEESDADNDSDAENESDNIQAINVNKVSEEELKAKSVLGQYQLYDRIFEGRIQLQKVVTKSHHLMQPDVFSQFKEEGTEELLDELSTAQKASSSLLTSILSLHEAVMGINKESRQCMEIDGKQTEEFDESKLPRHIPEEEDEEITSSEDESDDEKEKVRTLKSVAGEENKTNGVKRKRECDYEEFEEILTKRHCSMKTYRQKVISFWEERTKFLQNKSSGDRKAGNAYSAFEETFDTVLKRMLADRDKLLKRTQLRSVNRGNLLKPIGGKLQEHKIEIDPLLDIPITTTSNTATERYDQEIYDDTDFYSKYLEELIKTQIKRGSNKMTEAQFINFTQTLKKKNKKVVDTRRSKGRKLKYDVRPQLVSFVTPRPIDLQLEEEAIDKIILSLFGGNRKEKVVQNT